MRMIAEVRNQFRRYAGGHGDDIPENAVAILIDEGLEGLVVLEFGVVHEAEIGPQCVRPFCFQPHAL